MATGGRVGMGPITTIITAQAITAVSGGRMFICLGITRMADTIMILAIEASRAVRLGVDFTEVADSTAGAVVTEAAAAMADDGKWTIL